MRSKLLIDEKFEKIFFFVLLLFSFVTVVWIDVSLNATFDTGDGIQHYLISHYSWKHPQLFIDLWGKPFFTLVSSSFAQFGLRGMIVFQALCAVLTSYFLYKIAQKINLKYKWTLPVFIFFSPIYFAVINSGLTEILFGCMFMLVVWLITEKKLFASSIIASFMPFVRPEAYVVLPLICLVFIIRKKFFAIPLLLFATLIYTIIGYFYYNDIFWFISKNYKLYDDIYHIKGSFFHFIMYYNEIWGKIYFVILIIGLGYIIYKGFKALFKKAKYEFIQEEILLISGSLIGCLLLHSISFSVPGFLNNLGMMRYMTVLIPSSAFLALQGLNIIITPIKKNFYLELLIICILIFFVIKLPFNMWYFPFHLNHEQVVVNETANWIKSHNTKNNKIYYFHPHFAVDAEIDPFDEDKAVLLWSLDKNYINTLPDSTYIVWDSHYSHKEGKIPLEVLSVDTNLNPIKNYKYYKENLPFETWIFVKTNYKSKTQVVPDIVADCGLLSDLKILDYVLIDFDSNLPDDKSMLSGEKFCSGHQSLKYTSNNEFGPVFSKKINELQFYEKFKMIKICFKFFPCDSVKDIIPVIEVKENDKTIHWFG